MSLALSRHEEISFWVEMTQDIDTDHKSNGAKDKECEDWLKMNSTECFI